MDFKITPEEQFAALKQRDPDRDFSMLENNATVIAREYRSVFVQPYLAQLINKSECIPGQTDAAKYELACIEIITWTLGQELDRIPYHHPPTFLLDGYSQRIRDITLPFPSTELPEKWTDIRNDHHLKSIVFECKNYNQTFELTNKEIYQLFEYINPDQHGTLGIILSRFGKDGMHNSVNSALNKIYSLNLGYRILVLGDDDLLEMINQYVRTGTCVNFLADKIEASRNMPI